MLYICRMKIQTLNSKIWNFSFFGKFTFSKGKSLPPEYHLAMTFIPTIIYETNYWSTIQLYNLVTEVSFSYPTTRRGGTKGAKLRPFFFVFAETLLLKYHSVNQRQGVEIERLREILRCAFLVLVTVTVSSVFYGLWIETLWLKYHSVELRQGLEKQTLRILLTFEHLVTEVSFS